MKKRISLVVSVYNEEQALPQFYQASRRVLESLPWDYEIVFVNDGSIDGSGIRLKQFAGQDRKVKVIEFSRNFGHEAAMIAGIDYAAGDVIICMDADLQHPPEKIPDIVAAMEGGFDVVSMVRTSNASAGWFKNLASECFYRLINRMSELSFESNASDFFAISREVADVLKQNYREKVRFLRGYVQNVGFAKTSISYEAAARVAGSSKYSIKKLIHFSLNTILCFSNLPLKLGIYAGVFTALMGFIMMFYTIYSWSQGVTPSGYPTIIVLNCFMFAVLFLIVGIIGEYISILFSELKDRPIYIVKNTENIEEN